jgi:hypothetical protein
MSEEATTAAVCGACGGKGVVLTVWDRPGGPPGNGWAECQLCKPQGEAPAHSTSLIAPDLALTHLRAVIQGCVEDLDRMKAAHPPSKRGCRYSQALESLEMRLTVALGEIEETIG